MPTSAHRAGPLTDRISAVLTAWETRLVVLGCIAIVLRLWISPLSSSFWIDETGTVWAIQGTFQDLLTRLHNYLFPQMPLFALLMWGWSKISGFSETALRIPSVLASIGSTVVLYRLGKKLFGPTVGLYAVLAFVTLSHVDYAAADARPYAFAIFALTCTLYERVKYTESGSLRHAILYGVGCGICLNLVYFFAAAIAADVIYLLIAHSLGWARLRKSLILSYLLAIVLILPLVPVIRVISGQSIIHIVASGPPSWTDLGIAMIPPRWIIAGILGTAAALLLSRGRLSISLDGPEMDRGISKITMISLWAFLPALLIFAYSLASHHSVFLPRYLLGSAPGIALLGGCILAALHPVSWRLSSGLILIGVSISTQGFKLRTNHYIEDWKGASAVINGIREAEPGVPVIAASSYVESAHLPMPQPAGANYDFMLSQFNAYPIPGAAVLLPVEMSEENRPYIESVLGSVLKERRFLLLFPSASPLLPWVRGRLSPGFTTAELHSNPVVLDVRKR